ncbi:hypothetical protein [Virgibacillus chiguensis]|uniref:Uncharacterized protein n=1 Tax=Virgibacillus chiguensis TaxID=411959 RepID=A0A1M5NTD9_9BACI|nr:hypothetical protein [Virgibacillus chiguensis]SHG92705.1 hypothetical protein SAMN05421807_102335 [Virgibacillus chiguensis]
MKNKLIPIYREKEIYTLFFDDKNNKLYKFPHREKSSLIYILLFFVVLYGSQFINQIYQPYKGVLLNITLFAIANGVCFFIAKFVYSHYYIQKTDENIFLNQESMKKYATEGENQYRLEVNLGGGISLVMFVIGSVLFFIFQQMELLIIGSLGSVPLFIILINRPLSRLKILRGFQNKNIHL